MKIEVKRIEPVNPPKEYVLTLNQNELDLISACLGKTGGYDGPKGWRMLLDSLWDKIYPHTTKRPLNPILNDKGQFLDRDRIVSNT